MNKKLLKFIKIVGFSVTIFYLGICILLYFLQDDLLFHPQPKTTAQVEHILEANPNFKLLSFKMLDNISVGGFLFKDTSSIKKPLVIYFGGNAEEVSRVMDKKTYFNNCNLVLINYRGFGISQGTPSEKTMFSDALEIYDKLKTLKNVDTNHIIILGRSIGTGVATYLSSKRKTGATILITPYESMIEVAQEKYNFVPISLLIKHPFESKKYAHEIISPMLALVAKNDVVIPKQHAYNLISSWKGKTEFLEVNEDHNSIMNNEEVWKKIEEYVMENSK